MALVQSYDGPTASKMTIEGMGKLGRYLAITKPYFLSRNKEIFPMLYCTTLVWIMGILINDYI